MRGPRSTARSRNAPLPAASEGNEEERVATSALTACWCGGGPNVEQFRTRRFGLVRCGACGCYRIDPPPIASDTQSAAFYTSYYAHRPEAAARAPEAPEEKRTSRYWRVVRQVPQLEAAGESVADLGCGDGTLAWELSRQGWRQVHGFDVSDSRVALAARRFPEVQFTSVPFPGSLPPNSLEMVVSDNVLEHVPDPVSFVQSIRGALRRSGRAVLITPNMESGNYRLLGRMWTPELSPHTHIFLFTHAALARLLARCGFELERQGSFHVPPYRLSEWTRILARGMAKEAVWRAMQEAGALYSRLIREGPMLYAVARAV